MSKIVLFSIFLLAILLRLLYFPDNTYFGFDQARDSYAVLEIINGHFKITGPPTATGIINHGVLYYYIFAPFYFLWGGDPSAVSAFLRILNTEGVFLVFLIAYPMFGVRIAILSAFLFAISYEQTQFSLFLNHPSLAVISVLIFYLGLSVWIFRRMPWGLLLALFGLGISIQFEFVEIQLIAILILFLTAFRKQIPKVSFKNILLGFFALLLPLSTYVISEINNSFLTVKQIPAVLFGSKGLDILSTILQFLFIINRHFQDNLAANPTLALVLGIIFLVIFILLISKKEFKPQLIFLGIWFFGGLLIFFFIQNDAYFYNTGTAISLLIFTAFLIKRLFVWNKWAPVFLLALITASNLYLITKNNPLGPNQRINPQIGLLLKDEQRILDFIYSSAGGEPFAVNALTMPYNVNTTWSYLFEWYGKSKYGYVPVWGGDAAEGFPGNLSVERSRSKLPGKRFLIIEPTEGIPSYLIDSFIANEEKYASTIEKKKIGTIQVWVQKPK